MTSLLGTNICGRLLRATLFGLAVMTAGASASSAIASSCTGKGITQRIVFKKGTRCWTYSGNAVNFAGRFSRGQNITVRMTGVAESLESDGQITRTIEPRDVYVTGPREFYAGDLEEPGVLRFVVPTNGTYAVSFSPCAMQGGMGDVTICAE